MNGVNSVGLGHTASQRLDQLGRSPRRPGCAVQCPIQAATGQILQLQEWQAACLADGVDLNDIGMLDLANRLCFAEKPNPSDRVGVSTGKNQFQGARAVQADLPRLVDDAHPSPAYLAFDLITGNRWPGTNDRVAIVMRNSRRISRLACVKSWFARGVDAQPQRTLACILRVRPSLRGCDRVSRLGLVSPRWSGVDGLAAGCLSCLIFPLAHAILRHPAAVNAQMARKNLPHR